MDQKNQHNQNVYITRSNLQIQCNPNQNFNIILRARKDDVEINMETQETPK